MNENELLAKLGASFEASGHQLFLVGGAVRDRMLGRENHDLDFTTDATPDETHVILASWADSIWTIGREFGTIAAQHDGHDFEITTFRTDGPGRKPVVEFTDSLEEDLKRRDFTINAMAMVVDGVTGLHSHVDDVLDPFGGRAHLDKKIIDTPRDPALSFDDDPLRILRAARFTSQLGFLPTARVRFAMMAFAPRLVDISAERIAAEMDKLIMGRRAEGALQLLIDTGIMDMVVPGLTEVPWTMWGTDVQTRWADLLRKFTPQEVHTRLKALKFSSDRVREVTALVAMTQRFGGPTNTWDAPNIRMILTTAGTAEQFTRLCSLVGGSDTLLPMANELLKREGEIVPPLTGDEIMAILEMTKGGPRVGQAMQFLWELRLNDGPLTKEQAQAALLEWDQVNA